MKLKEKYKPGSADWLRIFTMINAITVKGKPLDKEQKKQFQLRGILPKLAEFAKNLLPDSPELLTEPVQAILMPGTDSFGYPASGPYAVSTGGGMIARHIRTRQYVWI